MSGLGSLLRLLGCKMKVCILEMGLVGLLTLAFYVKLALAGEVKLPMAMTLLFLASCDVEVSVGPLMDSLGYFPRPEAAQGLPVCLMAPIWVSSALLLQRWALLQQLGRGGDDAIESSGSGCALDLRSILALQLCCGAACVIMLAMRAQALGRRRNAETASKDHRWDAHGISSWHFAIVLACAALALSASYRTEVRALATWGAVAATGVAGAAAAGLTHALCRAFPLTLTIGETAMAASSAVTLVAAPWLRSATDACRATGVGAELPVLRSVLLPCCGALSLGAITATFLGVWGRFVPTSRELPHAQQPVPVDGLLSSLRPARSKAHHAAVEHPPPGLRLECFFGRPGRRRGVAPFVVAAAWIKWVALGAALVTPALHVARAALSGATESKIVAWWALLLAVSVPALRWAAQGGASKTAARSVVLRKGFHVLVIFMFLPGLILRSAFLATCLAGAFAAMLAVEAVRVGGPAAASEPLSAFLAPFLDRRDRGALVVTHATLLLGCALPVWVARVATRDLAEEFARAPGSAQGWGDLVKGPASDGRGGVSPVGLVWGQGGAEAVGLVGILALGVIDTFAGAAGARFGRHRVGRDTSKTWEGFAAGLLGGCCAIWALALARGWAWGVAGRAIAAAAAAAAFEATTACLDNLVVPVVGVAVMGLV
ncbi:unnamed protein product [Pedinophyceae sp. YPF-701]|nr:unnamed protein product [Pedinophyceae sp. YPF-701]